MAGKLQEGIKTAGLIFSVIVSISTVASGAFGFYFEHLKTSEAVDVSLSYIRPKLDSKSKFESVAIDLLLINKGDSAVTVSDLWFSFDAGTGSCCAQRRAMKENGNDAAAPILIPSMQVLKVPISLSFVGLLPGQPGFLPAPSNLRIVEKGESSVSPPSAPPPPIIVEKLSIMLAVTTIGPNYGRQVMNMPVGMLHVKDGAGTGYSPVAISYELTPIRKDPPFFKSIWNSLIDSFNICYEA